MPGFTQFFPRLTGFDPNPFQERVAEALLNNRSVVLRAPTGSGKTWAVVAPFLYSLCFGEQIADRLLYALPLRSLATSLYQSTKQDVANCDDTKHLSDRIRIQTGEMRDDPLFEGRLTFTTIDQLLSSYLIQPVGLPSRIGNINAGAILGSLVCFDEFHLLEPAKSMATAIEMLDTVAVAHPLTRFVIMTATLSDKTLQWLTGKLHAQFIDVPEGEAKGLPAERGKKRYYRWVDHPLSATAVATVHNGGRSIVITNTVPRAQRLFEELQSPECRAICGPKTQVRLLHSRFFPDDRKSVEEELIHWFGPKTSAADVILVATQVIEAGLDFSCDNLHTEVAPMSSVVQRAGRCARRTGETGTVWCYALDADRTGKPSYGPYRDVAELVDKTASVLRRALSENGAQLRFHDELKLVNAVHTEWELQQLRPIHSLQSHRIEVRKAMDGDTLAAVRQLVRDVASINVVITDRPESINFNRRVWPQMLSVPRTSLFALFHDEAPKAEWIAKSAREQDVTQTGVIEIDWEDIVRSADLMSAGWLIAIHPDCVSYDSKLGLMIGRGAPPAPIQYRERPQSIRYSYKREHYAEHIRRVCAAGLARDKDNVVAHRRLSAMLQITTSQLSGWLDLVYKLHDVGKLSAGWQEAAWKWQTSKTGSEPKPRPPLAHTDFDPELDSGKPQPRRPPHAAEGAYAVQQILMEAFASHPDEDLILAAFTAIVRHHGAFTSQLSDFRLIPQTVQYVAETLQLESLPLTLCDSPDSACKKAFSENLLSARTPEHSHALLLYLFLVRRLRVADQNSFKEE